MFTRLGRIVILVDDQEAALAFYRDVLGFDVAFDETTNGSRSLHLSLAGGAGVWLMPASTDEEFSHVGRQTAGRPLFVLYTDDLEVVAERLRRRGVETWGLREDAGARSLHLRDHLGNVIVAAEIS